MSEPNEPLQVNPADLHATAQGLDSHAAGFAETHRGASARVGQAALGSGLAAAALPELLTAWVDDGIHFGAQFTKHAEGHREAAIGYEQTDGGCAAGIEDASSDL
ncbi:hypothetical protein [Mycolicibacterium nivoides]|jgi:hypothetical protein|uniref:hypothetical protein n=1 Tax=Mycolicibacterium nivoides TaxID=2487344 RepID=UPI0008B44A9E|nr:hypothetical protein [Mycolicibacterium nivoides]MBN3509611.1 ESX-1 secretion-associated protein [Mycolicibacterium septicum]SER95728.1 hypothetical protein SAMN04488583_0287 [Mycobacterium sp. 88mf]SFG56256.1 hypothetical protein SAMN04488582_109102 [Mycobacterium sp. 455mf]